MFYYMNRTDIEAVHTLVLESVFDVSRVGTKQFLFSFHSYVDGAEPFLFGLM